MKFIFKYIYMFKLKCIDLPVPHPTVHQFVHKFYVRADGGTSSLFDGFDESSGMEEEEDRRVSKYSSMLWTYASVTRVGSVSSVGSIEYEMALG